MISRRLKLLPVVELIATRQRRGHAVAARLFQGLGCVP
jgi:hypothetical protein